MPTWVQAAEASQRRIGVLRSLYRERGPRADDLESRRELWAQIQDEDAHPAVDACTKGVVRFKDAAPFLTPNRDARTREARLCGASLSPLGTYRPMRALAARRWTGWTVVLSTEPAIRG